MIRNRRRWLASVLTIAIALGDCGSMIVSAAENNVTMVSDDSEETAFLPDIDTVSETDETGQGTQLPALHIGQIPKGEKLPSADDDAFIYDLPVSFEASESLILFANYNIENISKAAETGKLEWSILRGKKGMTAGSTSLINEMDDWTGFETMSESPYFTMTQYDEAEDEYCKAIELVSQNAVNTDALDYDYYIRAAYYPETENDENAIFYTAATVPFQLQNSEAADNAGVNGQDTSLDIEKVPADSGRKETVSENTTISENTVVSENVTVSENAAVSENVTVSENTAVSENTVVSENTKAWENTTVSENTIASENTDTLLEDALDSNLSIEEIDPRKITGEAWNEAQITDKQPSLKDVIGVLSLNADSVTLHPQDRFYVKATIVPNDTAAEILWASNNSDTATVNKDGRITAIAAGTAKITAKYGDMTASVRVEVVDDENDVYDLSGDIWVNGFQRESDAFVYTGQKITQNFRIYHKETLLKEKTDYTLSYKNNINAAAWNDAKAPSVTISLKGQYSGSVTLYYTIKPVDIKDIDIYNTNVEQNIDTGAITTGYEQAVTYSQNLKIPSPVLTFGKKALKAGKDFICDYSALPTDYKSGDSYKEGEVYNYTVNGIGNFTGSIPMRLTVVREKGQNFDAASVTLGAKQYEYRGTSLSKSDVTIETVKLNNQILDKSLYDYDVYAEEIEGAYVMLYPTAAGQEAGYRGCKKVSLKLTGDRDIKEAAPGENWNDRIPFSQTELNEEGGIFQQTEGLLTFGTEKTPLKEGTDYIIKYGNTKKAGKVTVTFIGKGRYRGSLKMTYEITPNSDKNNFTINWKNVTKKNGTLVIAYQKGGAVPDFAITDQHNNILKIKTDYTVKCTNNKTPGEAMICEIAGKGNYKGYMETVSLMVNNGSIALGTLTIPDKPYSTRENAWKSKATIKDGNGKTLSAGKDYEKEPTYEYENMQNGTPPAAGTTVNVTVHGAGCYEGSVITGSYRIYENNISTLKIVIDDQEYTGKEVTLTPRTNIHAYLTSADAKNKQNEIMESCYQIVEYKNNIKAGTAKVTLQGIGAYGGTKTYSFKIQKKAYRINHIKAISLNKESLGLTLAEKEEKNRTLTAVLKAETGETITNPTVIWSSSDEKIATVEGRIVNKNTVEGIITAKKEGNVTITATTQDGNRKAQCRVTILDAPVLKQANQTIEGDVGQTAQLELEKTESQEINLNNIVWESSNSSVVSIEKNGLFCNLSMKKPGAVVIKVTYKNSYVQQCYVVVKGDEKIPEGKVITYKQEPGTADDTPAINKLLRDWEWNEPDEYECLYIPAGVYHIDAVTGFGGIVLTDNQKLVMSPSALLIAIGNNHKNYQVINVSGRSNVTITGGQIVGERNEHTGSGGEWGHGIAIFGSTNVHISNVDISQCWGDGIYLGFYDGPDVCSNDITIENCILHHNRRNNLSITDVSNVTIRNCEFNQAKGTDPQYGIDIEPNAGRPCRNIKIYNSTFTGNAKAAMGIITPASDIRLEDCTLNGNFYNMAGKNVVLKNTKITGEIVDNSGSIKKE